MAILVGIDEAGFGPILGPLTVSSAILSVHHDLLDCDLWQKLQKSVANRRKHLAGRLLICDSKKAYSKSLGIKHLRRTVLACLQCLGQRPQTLNELLQMLCPDCCERLSNYPWYQEICEHRISTDIADIEIASSVFVDDLKSNGVSLLRLESCCLDVEHYNKMVSSVKNKANVLFSATSSLIQQAYNRFDSDDIQIVVDRQGGRVHYRKNLLRMFPDMELTILRETPANSSYKLESNGRKMRLHFVVGAEDRFLPVALASMISKYLRELLVHNINRYFINLHNDLKPTAGYWKDGSRFIKDVKTNIPHLNIDMNQLVRCR